MNELHGGSEKDRQWENLQQGASCPAVLQLFDTHSKGGANATAFVVRTNG